MPTVKDEIRRMLDELPDDVTYEDMQYHLCVRQKIERSLAEFKGGEGIPHEETKKRFAQWLDG